MFVSNSTSLRSPATSGVGIAGTGAAVGVGFDGIGLGPLQDMTTRPMTETTLVIKTYILTAVSGRCLCQQCSWVALRSFSHSPSNGCGDSRSGPCAIYIMDSRRPPGLRAGWPWLGNRQPVVAILALG